MEARDITLVLPKDVVRRLEELAVRRGTSVSRILVREIVELVGRRERYEQAKAHHTRLLAQPRDLGTKAVLLPRRRNSITEGNEAALHTVTRHSKAGGFSPAFALFML